MAAPFLAVPQISYATAPNAPVYRAIMRIFFENREAYGPRLSPAVVAEQLRVRGWGEIEIETLCLHLQQLHQWQALEAHQDTTRVNRASDLVRKQLVYDITLAGEACERFLDALDNLREQGGSLQAERLPAILTELKRILGELRSERPDPGALQAALTNLVAALDELRRGSRAFLRDLQAVTYSTDALDETQFADYKQRVVEYLVGFHAELERHADRISDTIDEIEDAGVQTMLTLVAELQAAPQYGLSAAENHERALAPLRRQWSGVRSWFARADGQPEFQLLNSKLIEAINWILRTVQRLKERRSRRIDRSEEYRHLARTFAASSEEECHALFHAAFGLSAPRHFGCPEDDPDLVSPRTSFWRAPAAPIEAHLRNPVRKTRGAGRGARLIDSELARQSLIERRRREREQLELAMTQLACERPVRLSDIGSLDEVGFAHLLAWLGRALETPEAAGQRRAESSDGMVVISLRAPADDARTTLRTPIGAFSGPDYELKIDATS